ncbi:MAG: hypothetical protein KBD29_03665 [Candidatus Magasanikbacteria bacterium]|nr:hypothetical protein [Candidatus Magasanikbacteria bacterium]
MYKRLFVISSIIFIAPILGFGCNSENRSPDTTVVTTTVQDTPVITERISGSHVVYHVYAVSQKKDTFEISVASTTMFGGNEATKVAIEETNCKLDDVSSCAGSLNNGFYISKKMSKKFSVSLPIDVMIVILQNGTEPVEITSEHFYNLYT